MPLALDIRPTTQEHMLPPHMPSHTMKTGGYPAHSHHDKIPPWWENVSNDEGGNVSVSKNHHTPLHHDELYFEVYMYKVTHITSVSFGINF